MFTPMEQLADDDRRLVLESLDAPAEWESTWDLGLTDPGDSFAVRPRWGRFQVLGRWPAGFPLGRHRDPRPWRSDCAAPGGHRHAPPDVPPIYLESLGAIPHATPRRG